MSLPPDYTAPFSVSPLYLVGLVTLSGDSSCFHVSILYWVFEHLKSGGCILWVSVFSALSLKFGTWQMFNNDFLNEYIILSTQQAPSMWWVLGTKMISKLHNDPRRQASFPSFYRLGTRGSEELQDLSKIRVRKKKNQDLKLALSAFSALSTSRWLRWCPLSRGSLLPSLMRNAVTLTTVPIPHPRQT